MGGMNTLNPSKINQLLKVWPSGTVAVQAWLNIKKISKDLTKQYVRSHWLERIGRGAFIKSGSKVDWIGGLYALQAQMNLDVHAGGKTALNLLGIHHFVHLDAGDVVWLFGKRGEILPKWFVKNSGWDQSQSNIKYITTTLFDVSHLGLQEHSFSNEYAVRVSSPERAILEMLYLVPSQQTLIESKYLIAGLMTLRPDLLQSLLEACQSVKVKRLFLFLADLCHLPCLEHLDLSKIDLGKGKRMIGEGGCYVSKYQISVSKNFVNTFKEEIGNVK